MRRVKTLSILIVVLCISACGSAVTPTINAVDVQNTAAAGAFTLVAETQAAIPTSTPLPPTDTPTQTPLPTNTPVTLPTASTAATFTPIVAASTATDPCLTRTLSWSPKGRPATIRLVNTTRSNITVSIYLNETPDHFECGYRVYNLASRNDLIISDLVQGCYNVWAFNNDPKIPVNAFGFGCINNSDKWTFEISQDSIKNL